MDPGWRYLGGLTRRLRWTVAGAVVAGLAWQAAAIASPLLIRRAVDSGILAGDRSVLWWTCAGIALLGAIEAVAGASRHYIAIRNRALADAAVRDAIFRRALDLDARYHDRVGAGELISRASNDAELVARLFDAIGYTIGSLLTIVAVSTVLLVVDWQLAIAVLAPLPLVSIGFGRYSRRYSERTKINQEELSGLTELVEETISGIRVVKGIGAGDALSMRFRRQSKGVVDTALDVAAVDAVFLPALETLPLIRILIALWYGGHQLLAGDISVGTFALFNFYLVALIAPLRTIGQRVSTVQRAVASATPRRRRTCARSLSSSSRRRPEPFPKRATSASRTSASPTATAGRSSTACRSRSRPGTSLALVGSTGSGESTAAALLARFYDPDAGSVEIGGVDVRRAQARGAAAPRRPRLRGDLPLRRHDSRQCRLRFRRTRATTRSAARRGSPAPPSSSSGCPRATRRSRRARLLPLGRPATADRDRAGDPRRPGRADPGRRNVGGRRDKGARDPRGALAGDGRPDDTRDRAPPGDDRARRPGRGRRRGPRRRTGDARRAGRPLTAVTAPCSRWPRRRHA